MDKFISFTTNINSIPLPDKFDYPHNYTPHLLAKKAAKELQVYLKNQTDFTHDFGIKKPINKNVFGKMFGVLVVKNTDNKIGYLAAFSGKIADSTLHKNFVPPVYDVLSENGFYLKTEKQLNKINFKLSELKNDAIFLKTKKDYLASKICNDTLLENEKCRIKERRKTRKKQGQQNNQQNINEEFYLREYEIYLASKIYSLEKEYTN